MMRTRFGAQRLAFVTTIAVGSILGKTSLASPLSITLEVNPTTQFDYLSQSYKPFSESGLITLTFENTETSATDYGTTTIANYMGGTQFTSPYTSMFPADPYGGGPGAAFEYTFPNVSDYPSTFIEEFAAQGNTFSYSATNNAFYAYHIEIRIDRRTPNMGGSGMADYGFTPAQNLAFLEDAEANPSLYSFEFNEYVQGYSYSTGTYLYGSSISDYNARIVSIDTGASPVPEPATALLLETGVFGLAMARWRTRSQV